MKNLSKTTALLMLGLFVISCGASNTKTEYYKSPQAGLCNAPAQTLDFDKYICSEKESDYESAGYFRSGVRWERWSFFKSGCIGNNYGNLALAMVSIGGVYNRKRNGVYVELIKLRLDPRLWANKRFVYAVELTSLNDGHTVQGPFVEEYIKYRLSGAILGNYVFSPKGIFTYNGKDAYSNSAKKFDSGNQPEEAYVPKEKVNPQHSYQVKIIIKEFNGTQFAKVNGPIIKDFKEKIEVHIPKPKVRYFPWQAIPDVIDVAARKKRYKKCASSYSEHLQEFSRIFPN